MKKFLSDNGNGVWIEMGFHRSDHATEERELARLRDSHFRSRTRFMIVEITDEYDGQELLVCRVCGAMVAKADPRFDAWNQFGPWNGWVCGDCQTEDE